MSNDSPFFESPSPGWKRDLPLPGDRPEAIYGSIQADNTPNSINQTFMELSTKTIILRGLVGWLGLALIALSLASILMFITFENLATADLWEHIVQSVIIIGSFWAGLFMLRSELHLPRDEPIRFNRARRKVYAYQYKRDWKRPFSKSAWGVKISIYDWENLRAEACEAYGALGTGGSIQTINLSVIKPGTQEFTERFIFSHNIYQGEEAWAMTQLFMQQGPEALPEFQALPRNRNTEQSLLNVFWRFAPKVDWPADIDLESRTAPSPDEAGTD